MPADLIVFAEDWGGLPSSTQHLMSHLAKNRQILWINSIGLRQPKINRNDIKRVWQKLWAHKKNSFHSIIPKNITVVNVTTLPTPKSMIARKIASYFIKIQLLPIIKKLNFQQHILWTSLPTAVDVIGLLNEKAVVYYCGDDFSALAGVDHKTVSLREHELSKKAHLIITASEPLKQKFTLANTQLLTHGVDYELFCKTALRAKDLPDNGKPIAGFYGSISEWLDIALLLNVIRNMPHWNFVFIGQVHIDISALKAFSNVFFLGLKVHKKLAQYSQHWTVSMLPFKQNLQIASCNPLKLYEYLAAGQSIVGTDFPALKPYKKLLAVINNSSEMIQALETAYSLSKKAPCKASKNPLRLSVSKQTWLNKAECVSSWIDDL